jgi:hypothetical protein
MSPTELKSLTKPPIALSPLLQAMWHDHHGDWEASHNIAQEINDRAGSWVHGYLHRKEGDLANASYWYRKAGKSMPNTTLEKEWEDIVHALIKN